MKAQHISIGTCMMSLVIVHVYCLSLFGMNAHIKPLPGTDILTLEAAQRMSIERNPNLAAIHETVTRAQYQVKEAQAIFWPQLNAGAGAEHREASDRELDSTSLLSGVRDTTQQNYDLSLQATWILFDGFQRDFAVKAARFGAEAAEAEFANARRRLMELVAQTYFQAQLSRQRMRISQADLDFNQRLLREAEAKRLAGTGSLSEEDNFKIRMNAARSNLIDDKNRSQVSLSTLAALLGVDPLTLTKRYELAALGHSKTGAQPVPNSASLLHYAQHHRPDLQRDHLTVHQADALVGQARARYSPQLALGGRLSGQRPDNTQFDNRDFGYGVSLTLAYPLFDGWSRRARVQQARAQVRQFRSLERQKILDIQSQVQEAIFTLHSTLERVPLQQDNVTLTRQVRQREEKAYQAGQSSLVRLNEVQRDLIQAEATLALTQVQLGLAWEKLHAATAKNLERIEKWETTKQVP